MHGFSPEADLYAYRAMVLEEYFSGEIDPIEMRILIEQDPELELMLQEHIEHLQAEADKWRRRVRLYSALTVALLVVGIILWWPR